MAVLADEHRAVEIRRRDIRHPFHVLHAPAARRRKEPFPAVVEELVDVARMLPGMERERAEPEQADALPAGKVACMRREVREQVAVDGLLQDEPPVLAHRSRPIDHRRAGDERGGGGSEGPALQARTLRA